MNIPILSSTSVYTDIFLLCFFVFTLISFFWWFAPWVPTRKKDLETLDKIIKLKKGQTFYELGCGDARVSFYFAKKYPDVKFEAFEIFLPIFLVAKIKQLFWGEKNLSIQLKNVFWQDLSNADMVYIYGMPDALKSDLMKKFKEDLKPGSKIVSYIFKINGWYNKPQITKVPHSRAKIYLYEV